MLIDKCSFSSFIPPHYYSFRNGHHVGLVRAYLPGICLPTFMQSCRLPRFPSGVILQCSHFLQCGIGFSSGSISSAGNSCIKSPPQTFSSSLLLFIKTGISAVLAAVMIVSIHSRFGFTLSRLFPVSAPMMIQSMKSMSLMSISSRSGSILMNWLCCFLGRNTIRSRSALLVTVVPYQKFLERGE